MEIITPLNKFIYISFFALLLGITSCKGGKDVPVKKTPDDTYRITFHQAIQEKMRGNYDISIELFNKCLEIDPSSDASHFALSDLYEKTGDDAKTMQHANLAYDLDKENKWYILRLAQLYYDIGNYHKSANFFKMIIADEKSLDIKLKYTESLIYSHQYEPAIDIINEIEVETGKTPQLSLTKHDMYLELNKPDLAQKELDELIADDPSNIENRLVIADYFLRTNQMEKAEEVANELVKMAPKNGEVRLMIADIELRKGNLDACFDHLRIGFAEDDVSLSRKLALIGSLQRFAFEDNEDAKVIEKGLSDLYEVVYDEKVQNDTLHAQYGYFLQLQNRPLEAIEQFKKVVDINPNHYDSWIELLYAQYNAQEFGEMFEYTKKAVELFPSQPGIFLLAGISAYKNQDYVVKDMGLTSEFEHQLGVLSWLQKDYKQANKYFDMAMVTDSYNGNAYKSKALCLLEEDKEDEAFKIVDDALNEDPVNSFFLDLKGQLFFKTGKFDQAKKYFENALIYEPKNPDIVEHYGDALFKLGDIDKAIKNWEQARDLGGFSKVLMKKIGERTYVED